MQLSTAHPTPTLVAAMPRPRRAQTLGALLALTKPRLNAMTVITAVVGYAVSADRWEAGIAVPMIVGTGLSGAGALALNQWRERDTDCVMRRTHDRPLPQGRVAPEVALIWSLALAIAGVALLAGFVNGLAAAFSAATIVLYVAVYTPLKRHTRWATEIGGIPGALPPLIGVAAAGDGITTMGWLLFALLWCWQMPHFFAIGWMCREDYRVAGFRLLPVIDPTGARTAAWAFGYAAALLVVSVLPWTLGAAGAAYGIVAVFAGAVMLALARRFLLPTSVGARERAARQLFAASLLYLPVVLAALAIDQVW